jgi:hypothetical protein
VSARRRPARLLAAVALTVALVASAVGVTHAAFTRTTQNPGNVLTAAPDWEPPSTSRAVVQKSEGGETGFLRTLGNFRAYAEVTDGGNPPSGTASVRAEEPNSGFTLPMAPGSFTVDGLTYNWASAVTQVPLFTFAGTYPWDVIMTDNLGQTRRVSPFQAVVDNTRPTATDVQTVNSGAAGRPNTGDTLTLTINEPLDRISIVAGWTTGTRSVTARILNGTGGTSDRLTIDGSNFGTVNLGRNDYVTAETTFVNSTLVRNTNQFVLTLGTLGAGTPTTAGGNGTMSFTPDADAFDRAGNRINATAPNESGGNDREF